MTRKIRAASSCRSRRAPFGGLDRAAAWRARARLHVARPDLRARGAPRRLLAHGARAVRRRLPRRRPGAQLLLLPPDAGRLDDRDRRARARLRGHPRRHRPDRAAGAGDRRPQAGRLCRHAVVPEDHPRKGATSSAPTSASLQARAGLGRGVSRRRCATSSPARGIAALPGLRHRRSRPRSPTRPRRA